MTITLEHTENLGAVQPGVPHNTYYPGDGAMKTKNGGKGGIGKDPSGAHVATTCGMTDSNSGGAPGSGWYENGWFECANQTDSYTFKGSEVETFTPSFTCKSGIFVHAFASSSPLPLTGCLQSLQITASAMLRCEDYLLDSSSRRRCLPPTSVTVICRE